MIREILEKITVEADGGKTEAVVETDGGYGDLGIIPTAHNPAIKKKKSDEDDVEQPKILKDVLSKLKN